jgi:hypothetical protein
MFCTESACEVHVLSLTEAPHLSLIPGIFLGTDDNAEAAAATHVLQLLQTHGWLILEAE